MPNNKNTEQALESYDIVIVGGGLPVCIVAAN